jgi:hypothetical protein
VTSVAERLYARMTPIAAGDLDPGVPEATNLVENPAPAGAAGYDDPSSFYINPADLGGPDAVDDGGSPALRFQTDAAPGLQGARYAGLAAKTFLAGVTYYFSLEARAAAAGGAALFFGAGAPEPGVNGAAVALTTDHQRFEVSWTPSANRTGVYCGIRSPSGGEANTYYARRLKVSTEPGAYFDGDTPGAVWLGAAGASESFRQESTSPLRALCEALALPADALDELVRGEEIEGGHPPWALAVHAVHAPLWILPWIANLVGVEWHGEPTEELRTLILDRPAFRRGTTQAMVEAMRTVLTGTRFVFAVERDTSPWRTTLLTLTAETPDAAEAYRRALAQKPFGLVLTHTVTPGLTWAQSTGTWAAAAPTWANSLTTAT